MLLLLLSIFNISCSNQKVEKERTSNSDQHIQYDESSSDNESDTSISSNSSNTSDYDEDTETYYKQSQIKPATGLYSQNRRFSSNKDIRNEQYINLEIIKAINTKDKSYPNSLSATPYSTDYEEVDFFLSDSSSPSEVKTSEEEEASDDDHYRELVFTTDSTGKKANTIKKINSKNKKNN
jgi:hypothetical protein